MNRNIVVAKFGGTSLADASQIKKACAIINADPSRKYVVASAPGKRYSEDIKITDMLYKAHAQAERYAKIIDGLGIAFDIDAEIQEISDRLKAGTTADYPASRGEYINSKIIAAFLGWQFVDAAEGIFFTASGQLDEAKTFQTLGEILKGFERAVVPGFYGSMPDGSIKTFSRGGSDVTGSIVARAVNADIYENWTDVSGMLSADPRIVKNPKPIEHITYTELRELSYMGASHQHPQYQQTGRFWESDFCVIA